jgi:hypothetical protein
MFKGAYYSPATCDVVSCLIYAFSHKIQFMTHTAGYTFSVCKDNLDVKKELNTQIIMKFVEYYR